MRSVHSIAAIVALAGTAAGCAQPQTYPRYSSNGYGYSQAAYYPGPGPTVYYSAPAPAYSVPPPNYQRSNVYASQADYYRNYQGIHDGPERTGP